jgi:hypothetical protein
MNRGDLPLVHNILAYTAFFRRIATWDYGRTYTVFAARFIGEER